MKKLTLLFASIFAMALQSMAHGYGYANINSYADAFVFDEMGVTFSVYPDGEFDFYLPDEQCSNTVSNGYVSATFNSGYDYNPYVQYDDFGAVIQVENVPVYYDFYGRVNQIGDVLINYRQRRVCQVGGLYVHYNRHGHYAYHTGYINVWNPYFVYRPFYVAFVRPLVNLCFVSYNPYRQHYRPMRYSYYRPYVHNVRTHHVAIGHTYRPNGHGVAHHRYTQTAGKGERAVVRNRRTITTADASPRSTSVNRSRTAKPNSNGTNKPVYSRNNTVSKPSVNRTSSSAQKPVTRSRQPVNTKLRTVQNAPSRSNSGNMSSRPANVRKPSATAAKGPQSRTSPATRGNSQSSGYSRTATKPASTSRTQSTSRLNTSRGAVTSRGTNRTSSRTVTKPHTNSRNTASKPKASSTSRTSGASSRGSSNIAKSPSRSSSSSRTVKKGSAKTSAKRGK